MTRRTTLWAAVALIGIAVSAALAWAASQLASQRVGLSAEPLSVAARLAPPAAPRNPATPDDDHRGQGRAHRSSTRAVAPATTATTAPGVPAPPAATASGPAAPTPAPPIAQLPTASVPPSAPSRPPPAKPRDDSGGRSSGGGGSSDGGQGPDD